MIRTRWLLMIALLAQAAPAAAQQDLSAPAGASPVVVFRPARAELRIEGWDRDSVRITSRDAAGIRLELERTATGIQIHERRDVDQAPETPRYQLLVPRGAVVRVSMQSGGIVLRGVSGDLRAGVVNGAISADTISGPMHLSTVTGPIRVRGSRGELRVRSVSGALELLDVVGPLRARSTSGDLYIRRAAPGPVEAETYSGMLVLDGALGGGASSFATHSGSIALRLPEDADATFFITSVEGRASVRCGGESREPTPGQPHPVGGGGDPVEVITFTGNVEVTCGG